MAIAAGVENARADVEVQASLMRVLLAQGKPKNDAMRTMFVKIDRYCRTHTNMSEAPEGPLDPANFFPMNLRFLERLKYWLEHQGGGNTAAVNLADHTKILRLWGFDVPADDQVELTLKRRTQKVPGGVKKIHARQALNPLAVLEIEYLAMTGWAKGDPNQRDPLTDDMRPTPRCKGGELMPLQIYAIAELIQIKAADRGDGVVGARFERGDVTHPHMMRYVTFIDKELNTEVEQVFCDGGFGAVELPQLLLLANRMDKAPVVPYFTYETGNSAKPELATGWAGPGGLHKAPHAIISTGLKSLARVCELATSLSADEVKARQWSGTHASRHIGPEIGGALGWPTTDIDVVGNWASPKDTETESGGGVPKRAVRATAKKRATSQSCSAVYRPRAERAKTIAVRKRMVAAARAFITRFGVKNLTYDTEWGDIIPEVCPPDDEHSKYRQFYGERFTPSIHNECKMVVAREFGPATDTEAEVQEAIDTDSMMRLPS